ncbi:MAG: tetratricopeptide repeat protein [Bacteroidales bacterium]|nr:tetratricopeptide repeat protein [Bacteroidales bacterium]
MKRIIALLILVASGITLLGADSEEKYMEGLDRYKNGDFREAVNIWTELYNSGYDNYELLYNTGNAYFKLEEIPHALLFYERALLRKPWDDDLRYNHAIANSLIKDRFEVIPRVFFARWFDFAAVAMLSDSWAVIALASFIITLVLIMIFLFTARYNLKLLSFWSSVALFTITVVTFSLAFRSRSLVYRNNEVIITAPVVTGRSTPSDGGTDLFVIHEGLKVRAGEVIGDWSEIRLPDGNKGWIEVNTFERI